MGFEPLEGTADDWSNEDAVDGLTERNWDELEQLGVRRGSGAFPQRDIWRRVEDYDEVEEQLNPGRAMLRRRHKQIGETSDE